MVAVARLADCVPIRESTEPPDGWREDTEPAPWLGLDEAAGWVDALAALGYRVPFGMTDDMRVEARRGRLGGDPPYDRDVLVKVLVYHQATSTSGCHCGWKVLGASHCGHVADVYEQTMADEAALPERTEHG